MSAPAARAFWALSTGYNGGAVIQKLPPGSPLQFAFFEGKPLGGVFPSDASVRFSDDFPKELKVLDSIGNTLSVPLVSAKVKAVLDRIAPADFEFLPVVVLNHKGKVASREHGFLNVLRVVDFIDMAASKYEVSALLPGQITDLRELHVRADQVDPAVHVFRASTRLPQMFIDDAVHAAFQQAGVTGLRMFPAEGWDGDTM